MIDIRRLRLVGRVSALEVLSVLSSSTPKSVATILKDISKQRGAYEPLLGYVNTYRVLYTLDCVNLVVNDEFNFSLTPSGYLYLCDKDYRKRVDKDILAIDYSEADT